MSDTREFTHLIIEVGNLKTQDELKQVSDTANHARKCLAAKVKRLLRPGMTVRVEGGRKLDAEFGTVVRINRTKCEVDIDGRGWNVPIEMIVIIDQPELAPGEDIFA